jgi:hypothetical protein
MAATLELRAEAIRTVAFGAVGVGYTAIGTSMQRPMRLLNVQNVTNAVLMFSFDGVIDHFSLPANSFLLLDICTNDVGESGFFISKGTLMHVKQIGVPTSGSVYVSTFYARGS